MPSGTLTTFYPGNHTTIIMLDHDHRYLTAFDHPTAVNVAHIIIVDSGRRPLSFLSFNCQICNLVTDGGRTGANVTALPDLGPPPAYEIDRTLPDYHQQDQHRSETDVPARRRRSLEQAQVAGRSSVTQPRRSTSGSPERASISGREALSRALRRQEEQAETISRDFQPLTPEAPPAAHVIARDFQPSAPTVQPERETPAGSRPPSTPVRMPRFSEIFEERHYDALARFSEEAREHRERQV